MKKFKLLTAICLAFIMVLCLGITTTTYFCAQRSAYADTVAENSGAPTFAINFYIAGKFYTQYFLNQNQSITKPTGFCDDADSLTWLSGSATGPAFDFATQKVAMNAIDLHLQISSGDAAVLFYKENPNYSATASNSDKDYYSKRDPYSISFIQIVPKGSHAAEPDSAKEPEKVGYNFSHWGTSEISNVEYDFNTNVADTLILYPKFTIKTFSVQFLVNGVVHNEQTVNYNAIPVQPAVPTSEGEVFAYWYRQGDANKTSVTLTSLEVQEDYVFIAEFTSAELQVVINNFVYGKVVSETGDEISFDTPKYATNGTNYVFYVQLGENYNEYGLTKNNFTISGTYTTHICEHPTNAADGFYKITVRSVGSDLEISVTGVTINKYDVTLNIINGLDLTIETIDYTVSSNVYTLDFTVDFKFKFVINSNYELAEGEISVTNCTYNDVQACWILNTSNADKVIDVIGDVREVVDISLSGVSNVTITLVDETYIITKPADYSYRVEKGKSFKFSAQTTGTYYLKSVSPATQSAGSYTVTADEAKTVTIVVVDTVIVSLPQITTGVDRVIPSGHFKVTPNYSTSCMDYQVELGSSFNIEYVMKTEYSQAVLDISFPHGEVDVENFPQVVIRNITGAGTVAIAEPNLNTYVVTLNNNAMVTLTDAAGTNRAVHAGNVTINIAKSAAYSNATISGDNITILGNYTSYEVAADYNSITIKGVTSAITLYVESLTKNKYSVSLSSSNVYGTLTATSSLVEYGNSFAFMVSLESPYSKTAINANIFNILSTTTGLEVSNELVVSGTTVSIQNITQSLTVSLKDLTPNTYKMTLPNAISGQYSVYSEGDTVVHNESFTFTITLDSKYNKNAETMTVTRKIGTSSVVVDPVISGNTLTYTVNNIVSNLTFSVSPLSLNIYTVEFYDPVELIKTVKVEHGQTVNDVFIPSKEGGVFNYWGDNADELIATEINFNNPIGNDMKCYAIFAVKQFEVTFKDFQGNRAVRVKYGEACEIPTIRAKEGYDVAYWDIPDTVNLNSVTAEVTVIIEAVYIQNTYTVLFKNGDTIHSRQMILHGEAAETPTNPTRRGYNFTGWNKSYNAITANTTIEAKFDVQHYTVEFYNLKNGNKLLSFDVNYGEYIYEPEQNTDNRSKYTFRYKDLDSDAVYSADKVLEEGFVLEGWYEDTTRALKFNFDETVDVPEKDEHGNFKAIAIYGHLQVTQMIVSFYVEGKLYTEKAVDYRGNLINIPAVPHKVGYDQKAPVWVIRGSRTDYTNITTDIQVDAKYEVNEYTVKFVFPGGKETYTRTITHGGSIVNIPLPATRFGEIVIYDKDAARYVTENQTVYIRVIDLVPYLVGIAAAGALALVVVGMAIAISTMKRNRQDNKKMEQLIKDIREQDKRLTQINERKLRAQVDAEMQRKERINKNKFLE